MFHPLNSTCLRCQRTVVHPKLRWLYITTYTVRCVVIEQYVYSSMEQMQPCILLHKLLTVPGVVAGSRPLVPKSEGSTLLSNQKDYCCSGTTGGDEMTVKSEWKSVQCDEKKTWNKVRWNDSSSLALGNKSCDGLSISPHMSYTLSVIQACTLDLQSQLHLSSALTGILKQPEQVHVYC